MAREDRKSNPDRYLKSEAAYRDRNRDKVRQSDRDAYLKDPEKFRKKTLDYLRKNPEKAKELKKNSQLNRSDKYVEGMKRRSKLYWERHPGKKMEYYRKRRARELGVSGGHYTEKEWCDLKVMHDQSCLSCGKVEPNIKLQADHVIPISKGGSDDISNIQPLCPLCNRRKATKTTDYRPKGGG
jgi:5-methylcytosine-specific restriction endonuclease McrA